MVLDPLGHKIIFHLISSYLLRHTSNSNTKNELTSNSNTQSCKEFKEFWKQHHQLALDSKASFKKKTENKNQALLSSM